MFDSTTLRFCCRDQDESEITIDMSWQQKRSLQTNTEIWRHPTGGKCFCGHRWLIKHIESSQAEARTNTQFRWRHNRGDWRWRDMRLFKMSMLLRRQITASIIRLEHCSYYIKHYFYDLHEVFHLIVVITIMSCQHHLAYSLYCR